MPLYLCRDSCVKQSHFTLCILFMHFVSQYNTSIPCMLTLLASSFIPTSISLNLFDFCKKSFNEFGLRLMMILMINMMMNWVDDDLRLMRHLSTCTDEWRPTASTLCPSVFLGKKSQEWGQNVSQGLSSENFLATCGFFNATLIMHVTALV